MTGQKITVKIIDSHRNLSAKTKNALKDFFKRVKGQNDEEAMFQVDFCCECFEKIEAVKDISMKMDYKNKNSNRY